MTGVLLVALYFIVEIIVCSIYVGAYFIAKHGGFVEESWQASAICPWSGFYMAYKVEKLVKNKENK